MPYKHIKTPAHAVTVERERAQLRSEYLEWTNGLQDGYIARFVEEGLRPFLKRHGYEVCYSPKTLTQACKEWAFAHVQIHKKGSDLYDRFFMKCAHNGGEDEFDWYNHTISFDTWETFSEKWATTEFLDDSDVGYAQRIDIAHFAWQLIHLDSSPNHIRWKETIEYYDLDEEYWHSSQAQPSEDAGAYGGDRRTL